MLSSSNHQMRRIVCVALIALLLGGFVIHASIQFLKHNETEDFGLCYHAAEAMLEGGDMYTGAAVKYIYPPFFAFAFQPFALLPETTAAIVWSVISAVLLLLAVWIAAKEAIARWLPAAAQADVSLPWLISAISLLLVADKVHGMFTLGQTDSLMLLGFACALRWMDRKPLLAGIAVGAAANVKYLSLICVPYFLLRRNYRAAISSIASFVLLMILPAIEIGFARLAGYMGTAFGGLARMVGLPVVSEAARMYKIDYERSLSFTSAAFRFTRSHGIPDAVALGLTAFLFAVIMAAIILIGRAQGVRIFRFGQGDFTPVSLARVSLEWAILIFLALAFSPQTMSRHMVLLALIFVVALAVLFRQGNRSGKIGLILAILFMVTGLSLPLGSLGLNHALSSWRAIAGASWCALALILALVSSGCRMINAMNNRESAGAATTS